MLYIYMQACHNLYKKPVKPVKTCKNDLFTGNLYRVLQVYRFFVQVVACLLFVIYIIFRPSHGRHVLMDKCASLPWRRPYTTTLFWEKTELVRVLRKMHFEWDVRPVLLDIMIYQPDVKIHDYVMILMAIYIYIYIAQRHINPITVQ